MHSIPANKRAKSAKSKQLSEKAMDTTTYIALSRQTSLWNQLEVIGNNLANTNTLGFKGSDVLFSEYLYNIRSDERPFKDKVAFTQDFGLVRDTSQGRMRHTNNPLDMAIQGDGFFALQGPNGEVYTHAGNFTLDSEGRIVNQAGYPLLSDRGQPIELEDGVDNITINGDGGIIAKLPDGLSEEVDRIRVVTFEDERELKPISGSLYAAEAGQFPIEADFPRIAQGALEDSNVNAVEEMTRMIALNRSYQEVHQMIREEHDRKKKANEVFTRRVSA